ncbi:MAG: hypothetical protein IIA05_02490 [Proteobacteria bacterium]|nr:hypothetical protein [Pseudomonadota bacterium]
MLESFQKFALFLRPVKPLAFAGLFLFAGMFAWNTIWAADGSGEQWVIPSIVGFLWALSVYSFIAGFQHVPLKADSQASLLAKLKAVFRRAPYWVLAFLALTSSVVVLILSYRLFSIWLRDFGIH